LVYLLIGRRPVGRVLNRTGQESQMNAGRTVRNARIAIVLSTAIVFGMVTGADSVRADDQASVVCTFTLVPTAANQTAASGASSVVLTASATGCRWTAVSKSAWIIVSLGSASGTGNGTVSYTVAANPLSANRLGTMTIAGLTFSVTQAGTASPRMWAAPAPIVSGTPLSATQLNAAASVAGTFTYTPPSGTVLGVGTGQPLSVTFTPSDLANYTAATATVAIDVTSATPTVSAVTVNRASPFTADGLTSATWTVVASGGISPLGYQIWRYNAGAGSYAVVQGYSTANTFNWTPTAADAGRYQIGACVHSGGSTTCDVQGWSAALVVLAATPAPLAVTSLLPNQTSPMVANGVTTVTWTATATGGVAPLGYQFWRYNAGAGTYAIVKGSSASNTFSWTPTAAVAGTYKVGVCAQSAGNTTCQVQGWSAAFVIQ
jgi:hypothetical protein